MLVAAIQTEEVSGQKARERSERDEVIKCWPGSPGSVAQQRESIPKRPGELAANAARAKLPGNREYLAGRPLMKA